VVIRARDSARKFSRTRVFGPFCVVIGSGSSSCSSASPCLALSLAASRPPLSLRGTKVKRLKSTSARRCRGSPIRGVSRAAKGQSRATRAHRLFPLFPRRKRTRNSVRGLLLPQFIVKWANRYERGANERVKCSRIVWVRTT